MANKTKGVKEYNLKICYNDATDEIEFISEYIDGSKKNLRYGDLILNDYFDEEGMSLMDELYEVGVT